MDDSRRSGDEIEQETREKAAAEMEWAAAEAAGERPGSAKAMPRAGKPATGAEQAAENAEDDPPA